MVESYLMFADGFADRDATEGRLLRKSAMQQVNVNQSAESLEQSS